MRGLERHTRIRSRSSSGGYVKYINLSGLEPETCTDVKCANEAFMILAGPWTQANWEGNCTLDRIVAIFQTQSYWDWPRYEEALDPRRAAEMDVRGAARDAEAADLLGRPVPKNPPPVSPPDPGWDAELRRAWPQIEHLAQSLLNPELQQIELSNGQRLTRYGNTDDWSDPNAPSVDDDES